MNTSFSFFLFRLFPETIALQKLLGMTSSKYPLYREHVRKLSRQMISPITTKASDML